MTNTQFLDDLEKELKGHKIPRKDIEAAREFYSEAIAERVDSGMTADEAIADLGSVKDIARTTYEENPPLTKTIAGMSIPMFILFIVAVILSSVFWAPFLVVFLMLFVFFALFPLSIEAVMLCAGGFIAYVSLLAFQQGHGNLSTWFLVFVALAMVGISLSLTPLTGRVAELAGRSLAHASSYLYALLSPRTSSRNVLWYKPVFTIRKFDKAILLAGGILAAIGILGALAIWASVGFDVNALPTIEPILLNGEYVTIDFHVK